MARRISKVSVTSGSERPDWSKLKKDNRNFKKEFDKAMYYAHYELSAKKLGTETVKYFKSKKLDHRLVDAVDTSYYAVLGKICFLLNNGGEVPENYDEYVESQVAVIIKDGAVKLKAKEKVDEVKEAAPVINIQDRLREQAGKVAEQFDVYIDTWADAPSKFKPDGIDPYAAMTKADLKAGHARWIVKFYENDYNELREVIKGECEQLKEAYGSHTTAQYKRLLKFYDAIHQAATMVIETSNSARKPRKKKTVSADKLVEKLKFQQTEKTLGLVSINPRDIIGAQELWVYNTKTRKIGKYIANDAAGLSVKSATILNFSPESTEKTLRKPPEQLKTFKAAGKVALRKYMANIATIDTKLKSRLNEHHILLKVVK